MVNNKVPENVDLWRASHRKVNQRFVAGSSKTQQPTSPRIAFDRDRAFMCLHQPLK